MKSMRKILDHLYKDVHSPASFTSVLPLLKEAKKIDPTITKNEVKKYLESQYTYTLHRKVIRRYPTLPTLASGLHTEWQADLAVFDRLSRHNRGYKYLLVCIDTLSRQLIVEPVKSKSSRHMINAFEKIFSRSQYLPWKIKTDQGKEFTAREVQECFHKKGIQHFSMYNPQFHAGMAERANRTIKERLYRYFTERQTQNWINVIQDIVNSINHSINRSIGMRPVDINFKNAEKIRQKLEQKAVQRFKNKRNKGKFKVGDRVRIEKYKHIFQKGFTPNFTGEIFIIDQIRDDIPYQPITYRIRDQNGEIIKGRFYAYDFSRVRDAIDKSASQPVYDIEKIIKKRKKEGKEYLFVKWKGYGPEQNSWIPASNLFWK
jgi:transposase InsO family protein